MPDVNPMPDPIAAAASVAPTEFNVDKGFDTALDAASQKIGGGLQQQSEATAAGEDWQHKAMDVAASAGLGVAKSFVETANTVGDVLGLPKGHGIMNSPVLKDIYSASAELDRRSPVNAITEGTTQFVTALLGVNKVFGILKVPGMIAEAGTLAKTGVEIAKGMTAASMAFAPHQARLSDLIQSVPQLRNPINEYLASNPEDSNATGRLKNALEGAGMDVAATLVFSAAMKAFRAAANVAAKGGAAADPAAKAALDQAEAELQQATEAQGKPTAAQSNQTDMEKAYGDVAQQQANEAAGVTPDMNKAAANQSDFEKAYGDINTTQHPANAMGDMEKAYSGVQDVKTPAGEAPKSGYTTPPVSTVDGASPVPLNPADGGVSVPAQGAAVPEGVGHNAPNGAADTANPSTTLDIGGIVVSHGRDTGGLSGRVAQATIDKAIKAVPELGSVQRIETNGIGYGVAPHAALVKFNQMVGGKGEPLALANPKTGAIMISDKLLTMEPAYQAKVIAHETGHVLEAQFRKQLSAAKQALDNAELKAASQALRPEHYDQVTARAARGDTAGAAQMATYLNKSQELFADTFSLWKTNPKRMAEVAPKTKAIFDQHFAPWIDTDMTTLAGNTKAATVGTLAQVQEVKTGAPAQVAAGDPVQVRMVPEASDEAALTTSYAADQAAVAKFGTREAAEANGYKFGASKLPWQKLTGDGGYQQFHDRLAQEFKGTLDQMKGVDVLHDARVARLVEQRVKLFNEDPSTVMGEIQAAGHNANGMVANMEAAFAIANKAGDDLYGLVKNLKVGNFTEFGGDEAAAKAALGPRMAVFVEAIGNAQAMRSAAGRSLRRLRSEFSVTPETLANIKSMDPEQLAGLIELSQGDARLMAKMSTQGFWERATRAVGTVYANNLLWLWPTHVRNMVGNVFMLATSPAQRAVGSLFMGSKGTDVRTMALREYRYMASAMGDAFFTAKEAYLRGDSLLSPHSNEFFRETNTNLPTSSAGKLAMSAGFTPINNVGDVFQNGLRGVNFLMTQPNRALGTADEFIKQMSYRGSVLSKASLDADKLGLQGVDYQDFLQKAMDDAMDHNGVATDAQALYDAQVRTFQQPLLPRTVGKTIATAVGQHPMARLVLPFVRTPINLFRYAVKLSPGINLLQKEYQQMIRGELGLQRQADAYGHMVLGLTAVGTIATMAHSGAISGGPPPDPMQAKALADTGWKPYSFISTNADGSHTYVPFNQVDPIGMLFGITADVAQLQHQGEISDSRLDQMIMPLVLATMKNLAQRTYLQSLSMTLDALSAPDNKAGRMIGSTVSSLLPFSSLMREVNPDPYMREARGIVDNVMENLPGFSDKLPPRRDAFGYPVNRVINVAFADKPNDVVDAEQERLMTNYGAGVTPPLPVHKGGLDLRDLRLPNGQTAFDRYQEISQQPKGAEMSMKQELAKLITSPEYKTLVDGGTDKGTKLFALDGVVRKYRETAMKQLLQENPALAVQLGQRQQAVREAHRGLVDGTQVDPNANAISRAISKANSAFGIH